MTMQSDFFSLAGPLFGNRVYPQGSAPPYAGVYATYSRVFAEEQASLDNNGGTGNLVNTRLQIDIYSTSFADAQAKSIVLKSALKGWSLQNVMQDEQDMYEPDTKLFRVMLDLSVWHY